MEQFQLAKKVFDTLLRVFHIFKLYPANSQHRQQAVAGFYSELVSFLGRYGILAFEIQKKEVLCLGEVVYEQSGRSGEFTLALYHEGMQWFQFLDGVSIEELEKLFEILDEYSKPVPTQTQQDLSLKLWEAQLPNIIFQDAEELDDLLPEVEPNTERYDFLKEKNIPDVCSYLLSLPEDPEFAGDSAEIASDTGELKPAEELEIQKMKNEEDNLDPLSEIFGALAYVCSQSDEKELLVSILELLRDGIIQALESDDLGAASRMLTALRKFSKLFDQSHWAYELFEGNFRDISKSEAVCLLIAGKKDTESISLSELKKFLSALHPEALQALIPATLQVWLPDLMKILRESITVLAASDVGQLERFPKDSDENLIFLVIETLGNVKTREAAEVLLGFTAHFSPEVVVYALKTLIRMDAWFPGAVFKLIQHESESVRNTALEYLGSRKNEAAERLLINHLEANDFKAAEKDFIFRCFETLGKCGSTPAYTFLRGITVNRKWHWKIFRPLKLEAAALGLQALEKDEAKQAPDGTALKPDRPVFDEDGKTQ